MFNCHTHLRVAKQKFKHNKTKNISLPLDDKHVGKGKHDLIRQERRKKTDCVVALCFWWLQKPPGFRRGASFHSLTYIWK